MSDQQKIMLETLRQSSVATAIYTSAALHIGFINKGMLALWGYANENEIVQFPDLLLDRDQQYLASLLSDVWNQGKPFHVTAYPVAMNGNETGKKLYADIHLQPIPNSNGETEYMIHTMQEVENPFSNWHVDNIQSKEILADEKLQQWSRALSHDLRNPLSVAKLGLQYMRSRTDMNPEEQNKWTTVVSDALKSVEKLIVDVVEVTKQERVCSEASELSDAFRQVIKQNQILINESKSKYNYEIITAARVEAPLFYAIFNLAIQSAAQFSGSLQHHMVSTTCVLTDNVLQFVISNTDTGTSQDFIGFTVLEQWIQQIKAAEIVRDSVNRQLIFSLPIL
ncbi:histidine kinase dimerization/phospho-acceptor domain-containing protein [Sphingobacterium corticibacter]|uniref:histidine kinase n=1 Tax=Sphingobacterium corticibacter TaxID=2171749 RepID=A0A2T8HI51_9SPHI|nr:histidine kinase dimerization/phospho-acceptor domain-containing protein [Sphingobacterium corticibacter]PVH25114.1 hypothetical protein DC487_09285 [Sphingobacterium corticibacter]